MIIKKLLESFIKEKMGYRKEHYVCGSCNKRFDTYKEINKHMEDCEGKKEDE